MLPVASADNPRFRLLLALATRARERRRQRATILEGPHLLEAYLERIGRPRTVFVPANAAPAIARLACDSGAEVVALAAPLFARASQVIEGPGPLAIIPVPAPTLPAAIDADLVYLDRIQDPGNVGSILRSAAALGVPRIVAAPGTASCWAPKVLRAAQGAHFALDIHEDVAWEELAPRVRMAIRHAAADAAQRIDQAELRAPSAWVFGSEGGGIAASIRASAPEAALAIPQAAGVESLNVGIAAAICLYEQARQRGFPQAGPEAPAIARDDDAQAGRRPGPVRQRRS